MSIKPFYPCSKNTIHKISTLSSDPSVSAVSLFDFLLIWFASFFIIVLFLLEFLARLLLEFILCCYLFMEGLPELFYFQVQKDCSNENFLFWKFFLFLLFQNFQSSQKIHSFFAYVQSALWFPFPKQYLFLHIAWRHIFFHLSKNILSSFGLDSARSTVLSLHESNMNNLQLKSNRQLILHSKFYDKIRL